MALCVEVGGHLVRISPLLHHVGLGDQTWIIRLGGKHHHCWTIPLATASLLTVIPEDHIEFQDQGMVGLEFEGCLQRCSGQCFHTEQTSQSPRPVALSLPIAVAL